MTHTFAIFTLSALFATGSAAVCAEDDVLGDNKFCKTSGDYIGLCDGTVCTVKRCTATDFKNDLCGDGATLWGHCEGPSGMCKYTEFVNVPFTVRAKSGEQNAVAKNMDVAVFQKHFDYEPLLSRFSMDAVRNCTAQDIAHENSKGKIACPASTATRCELSCNAPDSYAMLKDHNYECNGAGVWTGTEKGECDKKCPAPLTEAGSVDDTNLTGQVQNGVYLFTKLVANGVVTCKSLAQGGDKCTLSCNGNFRGKPHSTGLTDLRCTADATSSNAPAWKYNQLGSCEAAVIISGSVKLSLKEGETAADLKTNPTFMEKFKSAVAANVAGVDARHVRVGTIV